MSTSPKSFSFANCPNDHTVYTPRAGGDGSGTTPPPLKFRVTDRHVVCEKCYYTQVRDRLRGKHDIQLVESRECQAEDYLRSMGTVTKDGFSVFLSYATGRVLPRAETLTGDAVSVRPGEPWRLCVEYASKDPMDDFKVLAIEFFDDDNKTKFKLGEAKNADKHMFPSRHVVSFGSLANLEDNRAMFCTLGGAPPNSPVVPLLQRVTCIRILLQPYIKSMSLPTDGKYADEPSYGGLGLLDGPLHSTPAVLTAQGRPMVKAKRQFAGTTKLEAEFQRQSLYQDDAHYAPVSLSIPMPGAEPTEIVLHLVQVSDPERIQAILEERRKVWLKELNVEKQSLEKEHERLLSDLSTCKKNLEACCSTLDQLATATATA